MLEVIAVIFAIITLTAVLLSCYALHRAIEAQIEVRAMKESTHQVQFVPIDPTATDESEAEKELGKDENEAWSRVQNFGAEPLS